MGRAGRGGGEGGSAIFLAFLLTLERMVKISAAMVENIAMHIIDPMHMIKTAASSSF